MSGPIDISHLKAASVLRDPFTQDRIDSFNVYCFKSPISGWNFNGRVEFKNGDTSGEQKFVGTSLEDVLLKMQAFIGSL